MKRFILILSLCATYTFAQKTSKPNIVYILADDLGIGDVSCYNSNSKIQTPNIDKLASKGVLFTDAHSSSSVCTPTRYGILTGRYNWRSSLKSGVLFGYDKGLLDPKRETVASFLKTQGYQTGVVGKWHLGWDWANVDAGPKKVDFSKPIQNGPNSHGFDYSYCIIGSLDMNPYAYVENGRCTTVPVDTCPAEKGVRFYRAGMVAPDFKHEEVLPKFTEKAIGFINQHANKDKPFFLYFPLPAPHTPVLPTSDFIGKSKVSPYGDFVVMVDDVVKQVVEALKAQGVYENTLSFLLLTMASLPQEICRLNSTKDIIHLCSLEEPKPIFLKEATEFRSCGMGQKNKEIPSQQTIGLYDRLFCNDGCPFQSTIGR